MSLAGACLVALTIVLTAASTAAGTTLAEKKAGAKEIQAQVGQLDDRMEMVVEQYNVASGKLDSVRGSIRDNERNLLEARYNLTVARRQLEGRAVSLYKQSPTDFLSVVLAESNFEDLVTRLDLLDRVIAQDSDITTALDRLKQRILDKRVALAADRKAAERLVKQRAAQKADILAALRQRQEMLAGVKAEIDRREAQAAAAARARALAAQSAAAATVAPVGGAAVDSGTARSEAVAIARRYLGVPYVWGGAGPSGFDCSGLTMYVFAQLGVSLPHSAALQYTYGTHVSRDQLQPGDLIFAGPSAAGIHHVGIYVGGGQMIDAPYTGAVVRYSSIDYHYFGATRL